MLEVLRGEEWDVRFEQLDEFYGYVEYDDYVVSIGEGLNLKELLGTLIHEGLHVCFPDITEEAVDDSEQALSTLVWNYWLPRLEDEFIRRHGGERGEETNPNGGSAGARNETDRHLCRQVWIVSGADGAG